MIRFEAFERTGPIAAAFTEGSDGDFGLRGDDTPGALEARRRFAQACGADPQAIVCVQQVHGADVVGVTASERGRGALAWENALGPADALITGVPDTPLAVLVADCVPIYLYDPAHAAIGLVHAGWRGTFDRIAARTIEAMRQEWGSDPADFHALIGPSAGPCCYEVSGELAERFHAAGLVAHSRNVDLWASNAKVLTDAGVPSDRIEIAGLCTLCTDRFHSHRRAATPARNMALLMLR